MDYDTNEIILNAGDKIYMFTYGVTEAFGENEEMYEEPRLEKFLASHFENDIVKLVRSSIVDVLKFIGKNDQSDDITVLAVGYNGKS